MQRPVPASAHQDADATINPASAAFASVVIMDAIKAFD
jgi:3-dehydroquinate dehydratase